MSVQPTETTAPKAWFATHRGEIPLVVATALLALAAGGLALHFGLTPSHVVQLPFDLKLSLPLLITGSAGVALGITLTIEIARMIRKGPASKLKRVVHEVPSPKATIVLFYRKGTKKGTKPDHVEYYKANGFNVIEREVWGRVEELEEELGQHEELFVHAIGLSQECGNHLAFTKKVKRAVFENTPATTDSPYQPRLRKFFSNHAELDLFFMYV